MAVLLSGSAHLSTEMPSASMQLVTPESILSYLTPYLSRPKDFATFWETKSQVSAESLLSVTEIHFPGVCDPVIPLRVLPTPSPPHTHTHTKLYDIYTHCISHITCVYAWFIHIHILYKLYGIHCTHMHILYKLYNRQNTHYTHTIHIYTPHKLYNTQDTHSI